MNGQARKRADNDNRSETELRNYVHMMGERRRASDPLNKRPKFFDPFTYLKGVADETTVNQYNRQCTTTKGWEVTILQTSFKHGP